MVNRITTVQAEAAMPGKKNHEVLGTTRTSRHLGREAPGGPNMFRPRVHRRLKGGGGSLPWPCRSVPRLDLNYDDLAAMIAGANEDTLFLCDANLFLRRGTSDCGRRC